MTYDSRQIPQFVLPRRKTIVLKLTRFVLSLALDVARISRYGNDELISAAYERLDIKSRTFFVYYALRYVTPRLRDVILAPNNKHDLNKVGQVTSIKSYL